ncbi:MarR family winged helix-turn-helix transcriptional regulator [Microbacterium sp. SORGH_AS_0888]|uniref:MarR family winged helix-turn-helix transcriptional regulator n=1 Tax=Microbacterium sp. SORGH_AS_0888 TaxID=3041791 RepID=UPI00278A01F8|nr:MarR family transcriptional regulator [Microbacterium sp. SORGH_AS_0888]MDQ1128089.1 DNA-binding MarR family transcriptional regulator [Microbacterium sp. SORGH_AS_0888]
MPASAPLPVDPIAEAKRQWLVHGWHDAATGMAAVTSIMRAQQIVLSQVESVLRPFSLSFARFELLRLLGFTRGGELPMSSAVARLQVHPTSVTKTVDRLVRDGMVERAAHPTDGRATMLTLTPRGSEVVEQATAALNAQVFARPTLAGEDLSALVGILARMRRNVGDFRDPDPLPDPL